jgi:hypothetical protein
MVVVWAQRHTFWFRWISRVLEKLRHIPLELAHYYNVQLPQNGAWSFHFVSFLRISDRTPWAVTKRMEVRQE